MVPSPQKRGGGEILREKKNLTNAFSMICAAAAITSWCVLLRNHKYPLSLLARVRQMLVPN